MNEIIDYIDCCDYAVSNDTGLMHIASAFGKKIMVFLGPTKTKPIVDDALIISLRNLDCKYCYKSECASCHCMKDISPEDAASVFYDYVLGKTSFSNELLLIETTAKNACDIYFSTEILNGKINDTVLCFNESVYLLFQFVWRRINQRLYYKNKYDSFYDMLLNTSEQKIANPNIFPVIQKILLRKFTEPTVSESLVRLKNIICNSSNEIISLLNNAIEVSNIIYSAIRTNDEKILPEINKYLKNLDEIDSNPAFSGYFKNFLDLLNVLSYKKNAADNDFLEIAGNTLKAYKIKLFSYKILLESI